MQAQILAILAITSLAIAITPAYAEKNLDYTRVLDVKKESLESFFADLSNLKKVYPDVIKSVKQNDDTAKITVSLSGFNIKPEIKYLDSEINSYNFEVISGNLKGSKIATNLQETWGYDGEPNGGTLVDVKMKLRFSGLAYFIEYLLDEDTIESITDQFLHDITNTDPNVDPEPEEPVKPKPKGKRTR